jgi:hypothetical protein
MKGVRENNFENLKELHFRARKSILGLTYFFLNSRSYFNNMFQFNYSAIICRYSILKENFNFNIHLINTPSQIDGILIFT